MQQNIDEVDINQPILPVDQDTEPAVEYVEVEFRSGRNGYYVNSDDITIEPDDLIVVEVERGEDIARVISAASMNVDSEQFDKATKTYKIHRVATEDDFAQLEIIKEKEDFAHTKYVEMVERYPFEMKLLETVYQLDGNKVTFFFTADGRVDFRAFVRELASLLRTRIELHQTSGRDEAKRLGGYGLCGYRYCCTSFLKRFNQVTIKMAKDQNLSNNLSKISGPCGRLLCCLHFEENFYVDAAKDFPEPGDEITYQGNKMYVFKCDYYNAKVHLSDQDQNMEVIALEDYVKLIKGKNCGGCPKHNNHK